MAEGREALTPEGIVAEAVSLIRERGLDGLSMRTLAGRMGVTAPALYTHLSNRGELMSACAQHGYRLVDQAQVWIVRVDRKELRHKNSDFIPTAALRKKFLACI